MVVLSAPDYAHPLPVHRSSSLRFLEIVRFDMTYEERFVTML